MSETRSISLLVCPKDSPVVIQSGYAKIAQYVTPYLMEAGYDVRLHCPVGNAYNTTFWTEPHSKKEFQVWGGGGGAYGEDVIPAHIQSIQRETGKPGFLFFIGDVIALERIPAYCRDNGLLAAAWGAVDWEWPTPRGALERWQPYYRAWSMSHHGHRVLQQDGLKNLMDPLWFGVNPEVWKPLDRSEYPRSMASLGYTEDTFNVFSCFANQYQRKGEYEMFQAVGEFHKRHPEANIRFFALTQVRRDWDLAALVEHLRLQDIVTLSDDYRSLRGMYQEEDVARAMNMADVVLSVGYEGFGFQTIEAQCINKCVIGLDAAATPELLHTGIKIPVEKEFMYQNLLRRALPNGLKLVEALEKAWYLKQEGHKWNGRPWILENLTWDICGKKLVQRMNAIEQSIADEDLHGPPGPGPLALRRSGEEVTAE